MLADQMIHGLCDIDLFHFKVLVYLCIWFKTQIYLKPIYKKYLQNIPESLIDHKPQTNKEVPC